MLVHFGLEGCRSFVEGNNFRAGSYRLYLPVEDILLQFSQSSNSLGCCETTDAAKFAKP